MNIFFFGSQIVDCAGVDSIDENRYRISVHKNREFTFCSCNENKILIRSYTGVAPTFSIYAWEKKIGAVLIGCRKTCLGINLSSNKEKEYRYIQRK